MGFWGPHDTLGLNHLSTGVGGFRGVEAGVAGAQQNPEEKETQYLWAWGWRGWE